MDAYNVTTLDVITALAVHRVNLNLLGRDQIELARGFGIKQGAFLLVAAAPVFMPAGDAEKVAWSYALLAGFVFVEIGTFNAYDPYIGGMGMPASIPSGHEFRVRAGRATFGSPQSVAEES